MHVAIVSRLKTTFHGKAFWESESSNHFVQQIGRNNCKRAAVSVLGIGIAISCSLCDEINFLLSPGTFFGTKLFDTSTRCEKGLENEMQKHECDGEKILTNDLTFF